MTSRSVPKFLGYFFSEDSVPFDFLLGISGIFGNSTISVLPRNFPQKFRYILACIDIFRNFWLNSKRPWFSCLVLFV